MALLRQCAESTAAATEHSLEGSEGHGTAASVASSAAPRPIHTGGSIAGGGDLEGSRALDSMLRSEVYKAAKGATASARSPGDGDLAPGPLAASSTVGIMHGARLPGLLTALGTGEKAAFYAKRVALVASGGTVREQVAGESDKRRERRLDRMLRELGMRE